MKGRKLYLEKCGVKFIGEPRFIHYSARIDTSCNVELGDKIVISANVFLLTHDYSLTTAQRAIGEDCAIDSAIFAPIRVKDNCFIGLGAILLPGTILGNNVIVGAGSVVRGEVADDSIVIGNPAFVVKNTKQWAKDYNNKENIKVHKDNK